MQITLCEDDGIFFGGIPKNVVIVVKFDDGKTKRLPYPADKSISNLYEDLAAISTSASVGPLASSEMVIMDDEPIKAHEASSRPTNANKGHSSEVPALPFVNKSNIIEKEDIVTLVKLDEGRNKDASCDLVVGGEYRVIKVIAVGVTLPGKDSITQMVQGYDVVSDSSDRPERTRVFPHEVQLLRKRNPPPVKDKGKVEEILKCPTCQEPNACYLDGTAFKGECVSCHNPIEIKRLIQKCATDKCGNDVALFEIEGTYHGTCTKCKGHMGVEHA